MRLLTPILNFELKKAFNKRNILVFLLMAAVLQVFLQVGMVNYNDIVGSKDTFQMQEKQKTARYMHFGQYGSYGIWLKFIPHVNSIIFFDSTFDNLFCNVDSTYVFNIYTPVKGRKLFANRSRFLNFSAVLLLLGVLGCLVYGMDTIVRKDYLKFISISTGLKKAFWFTVMARLMILFWATIVLYAISLLPLLVFDGINLFSMSFPVLFGIILLFFFFFAIGNLVGLLRTQLNRVLALVVVYFFMVFLLPWALGLYSEISAKDMPPLIEYDFRNFNILMQKEKSWVKKHGMANANKAPGEEGINDFKIIMKIMKKTFRENEDRLKRQSLSKIKTQQAIASFLPTLFYFSICESSSSAGIINYIDFHTYCQEKKEEFTDFIIDKTFPGKDKPVSKKIENFIKGDDDIFYSQPKLPNQFWLGVSLTFIYTLALLFLSYKKLENQFTENKTEAFDQITFEQGNVLFLLCESDKTKAGIFNHFKKQNNAVCLEKINTTDFHFNGVKPPELLKHLCRISGVDEKIALENLKLLNIKELEGISPCHEITLNIYAAIKISTDFDLIAMDEFLKNESREFEQNFFHLLMSLEESGKNIIYLSCQMKQSAARFSDRIKVQGFKSFPLEFKNTSLR